MQEPRFLIDDSDYFTLLGNTTMQSALSVGYDIPRFCYHEKLSIAGNCRMCLLEVSYPRSLKPVASCALPIMSGISIYSNTVIVKRAREGVLELLLLNHPLDCPVCDQGGECDLQDETSVFGGDRGRFYEAKRTVEDKDCGPIIKTSMNRCIHCTKCVRFCNEICGESILGTLGRGSDMEIGTYVDDEPIESEFSGNLADICPVGALTSKPYAFRARPWELRSFETVDVIDSFGSRIRIDIRGIEVLRILPSQAEDVNEDWITDRTRFSYDGLKIQRLNFPMVKIMNVLTPVSWETAFRVSAFFLNSFIYIKEFDETYLNLFLDKKTSVFGFFGALADAETLLVLNDFFHEVGVTNFVFQDEAFLFPDFRSNYLLNLPLDFIEKIDLCILVGLNVRLELPLLNLRLRKAFLHNNALIISFGFLINLTYQYFQQGNNINSFFKFLNGKSYASKCLVDSVFPLILFGSDFLKLTSSSFSIEIFRTISKYSNIFTITGWVGLSVIDSHISLNASKELGISYTGLNDSLYLNSAFFYLIGVERAFFFKSSDSFSFKIFQGHSGDSNALAADVVFPGSTFIEKDSLYITLEGRVQKTKFLLAGPSFSRSDWKIVANFRIYFFSLRPSVAVNLDDCNVREHLNHLDEIRRRLIECSPSFDISETVISQNSHVFSNFFVYLNSERIYRGFFYLYNFFFS